MPITCTKTLQGIAYVDLYAVIELLRDGGNVAVFRAKVYASKGHYDDGFLPLIQKQVIVENATALTTYRSLVMVNMPAALQAVEGYIVQQAGLLDGGIVT